MDEIQLKGLFYNCDENCFTGNKCKEQKLFMAISVDVPDEDVKVPLVEEIPFSMLPRSPLTHMKLNHSFPCMHSLASLLHKPSSSLYILRIGRSSSLLTVVAPTILFITALPMKPIAIFVLSVIFKS
jgi:hypothetical protein